MLSKKDFDELKSRIWGLVGFEYDGELEFTHFDGVRVLFKNGKATLGGVSRAQAARALFLFAMERSRGSDDIDIAQKPRFERLGVMLDLAVPMTAEGIIKYMEHMAALGFNYLLMYMETAFEVKEYPFMGYMRGGYSKEELQRIDAEGEKLGIEVVPGIQTLGHLQNYLRWRAAAPIKENSECLLVDCPESYTFIESLIRTVSDTFKTRRVFIGMDEAHGMGLGAYLKDHPYPDRMELFTRHLKRVNDICRKYGREPMVASDMPFRLGGDGFSDDYDPKSIIPETVSDAAEGIQMCYWEYYKTNYETYDFNLRRHKDLFKKSPLAFWGGVWVLDNHLMNMPHTLRTSVPALHACLDNGVQDVLASVWGSAKNTNLEQSIPGLPVFSEYCYQGYDCTEDHIYRAAEYLTGLSRRFIEAVSEFHLGRPNSVKPGSRLIWTDILYGGLLRMSLNFDEAKERFTGALKIIEAEPAAKEPVLSEFAALLFRAAIVKCDILKNIRVRYKEKDLGYLKTLSCETIPALLPIYERIGELMTTLYLRSTKPFGVENVQILYAGMTARLKFAAQRLNDFAEGKISRIEELEGEILDEGPTAWLTANAHIYT